MIGCIRGSVMQGWRGREGPVIRVAMSQEGCQSRRAASADSGPRVAVYEYALAVAGSATPRRPVPMNSTISAAAIHNKARQHEGFEIGSETDAPHASQTGDGCPADLVDHSDPSHHDADPLHADRMTEEPHCRRCGGDPVAVHNTKTAEIGCHIG